MNNRAQLNCYFGIEMKEAHSYLLVTFNPIF